MGSTTNRVMLLIAQRPLTVAVAAVALAAVTVLFPVHVFAQPVSEAKPTIVLVHGAFAESSSWDKVTTRLLVKGYPVVAVANPLRSLKLDASYVASVVDAIKGPVILVGHSYGGSVITNTVTDRNHVRALIFVAGFAPDEGESTAALAGRFPGSTLGSALAPPVPLGDGGVDLYIAQKSFRAQFAADLPIAAAELMAVAQRPIAAAAIDEPVATPAWKTIPSWFVFGELDKNIPQAAQQFMAKRAGSKRTIVVKGASHVVMVSHPESVVTLIDDAATATTHQ